jgi:hypothetical protein
LSRRPGFDGACIAIPDFGCLNLLTWITIMSGPIVRTGTTPKFWENYDRVFGGKKKAATTSAPATAEKPTKKAAKKATKKASKKAAKKA